MNNAVRRTGTYFHSDPGVGACERAGAPDDSPVNRKNAQAIETERIERAAVIVVQRRRQAVD